MLDVWMIYVPPSPWKNATTRTVLLAVFLAAVLIASLIYMIRRGMSDADRPMSDADVDKIWRNAEKMDRRN